MVGIRYYGEVFADAAQETGRFANRQGLLVAAIVALAAAVIQASLERHVMAWHVVRAPLIALVALPVLPFLWNLVAGPVWRELRIAAEGKTARDAARAAAEAAKGKVQSELDVNRQDLANTRFELERAQAAEQVFGQAVIPMVVRDRLVRLADLPAGIWLHNREFENCQFVGPAKVLIAGGSVDNSAFYGFTEQMFVAVNGQEMEPHFADSIVFQNSLVVKCEFHNVRILGNDGTIRSLRHGMTIRESQ